jgi:hypothetical protein
MHGTKRTGVRLATPRFDETDAPSAGRSSGSGASMDSDWRSSRLWSRRTAPASLEPGRVVFRRRAPRHLPVCCRCAQARRPLDLPRRLARPRTGVATASWRNRHQARSSTRPARRPQPQVQASRPPARPGWSRHVDGGGALATPLPSALDDDGYSMKRLAARFLRPPRVQLVQHSFRRRAQAFRRRARGVPRDPGGLVVGRAPPVQSRAR